MSRSALETAPVLADVPGRASVLPDAGYPCGWCGVEMQVVGEGVYRCPACRLTQTEADRAGGER